MNTNELASVLMMPPASGNHGRRPGDERLIRLPQVLSLVGLGKTTVYALMKDGDFPQPRKVRHLSLWVESEVQDWIRNVVAPAA